jgi:hypothetical protein
MCLRGATWLVGLRRRLASLCFDAFSFREPGLLRWKALWLYPLFLRNIAPRCVSKDGHIGASWFSERCEASSGDAHEHSSPCVCKQPIVLKRGAHQARASASPKVTPSIHPCEILWAAIVRETEDRAWPSIFIREWRSQTREENPAQDVICTPRDFGRIPNEILALTFDGNKR